jgi:hypothetical protein
MLAVSGARGTRHDRLAYGRRASPYEVLSEFADRISGTYSTEEVLPAMARMLAQATGAVGAQVWLRSGGSERLEAAWPAAPGPADPPAGPADGADGRTRAFAVEHRGERLGELRVTCSPSEPLTAAGDRLVRDVAAQAGLVLRTRVTGRVPAAPAGSAAEELPAASTTGRSA